MKNRTPERLHLFRRMEEVLTHMTFEGNTCCSDAELKCMKHIYRKLRTALYREEVMRIERQKNRGELSPKEAVHRKALCRKRYF